MLWSWLTGQPQGCVVDRKAVLQTLATELVGKVRQAEAEAREMIAEARAASERMLSQAQTEAAKAVEAAETEARSISAAAVEAARSDGRAEAAKLVEVARGAADQTRSAAGARVGEAVKLVMERIVKA